MLDRRRRHSGRPFAASCSSLRAGGKRGVLAAPGKWPVRLTDGRSDRVTQLCHSMTLQDMDPPQTHRFKWWLPSAAKDIDDAHTVRKLKVSKGVNHVRQQHKPLCSGKFAMWQCEKQAICSSTHICTPGELSSQSYHFRFSIYDLKRYQGVSRTSAAPVQQQQ